jgi:hypothetical protein
MEQAKKKIKEMPSCAKVTEEATPVKEEAADEQPAPQPQETLETDNSNV